MQSGLVKAFDTLSYRIEDSHLNLTLIVNVNVDINKIAVPILLKRISQHIG